MRLVSINVFTIYEGYRRKWQSTDMELYEFVLRPLLVYVKYEQQVVN